MFVLKACIHIEICAQMEDPWTLESPTYEGTQEEYVKE